MSDEKRPKTTLTDGSPVTPEHREIEPATGMQKGYVVLSQEERAKGFVRPVRRKYVHVGPPGPTYPLRDLTFEEQQRWADSGYVKYEQYPEAESPKLGRFWTQDDIDRVNTGCGALTTMAQSIAETYARDPHFYGATFCAGCRTHLPIGERGEFVWDGTSEKVGT